MIVVVHQGYFQFHYHIVRWIDVLQLVALPDVVGVWLALVVGQMVTCCQCHEKGNRELTIKRRPAEAGTRKLESVAHSVVLSPPSKNYFFFAINE